MSRPKYIVFAGGGTGGHLLPGLALIEWLREHDETLRFEFFCTRRPIDTQLLTKWSVRRTVQPVLPIRLSPIPALKFLHAWRQSVKLCADRFTTDRPDLVIGTGGFGSGPAVKAASRLGIRIALLNPDAIPGRANRYLAGKAEVVFTQWAFTNDLLPGAQQVLAYGCPVRKAFFEPLAGNEHALLGLDGSARTLLVTGASLGARTINQAIELLAPEMAKAVDWQILHVSGGEDTERLRGVYQQAGVRGRVCSFTDHMPAAMRIADLAITRAGAVTLAELAAAKTPAILMPYPFHRDRHQTINAQQLFQSGAALHVPDLKDAEKNAAQLRTTLLPLMREPEKISTILKGAAETRSANATEAISKHLLKMLY